jgi:hypothetical protein
MSTAKIAAQIAEFEKQNPKARGIPPALKEEYYQASRKEPEGKRTPIMWRGREAFLESHGTRGEKPGADRWKVSYKDTGAKKGHTRRAGSRRQSLTIEDYRDYAKRNGYSQTEADKLFKKNEKELAKVRRGRGRLTNIRGPKTGKFIYEHLSPQVGQKYGGVEHYRNIVLMDEGRNTLKSDKMPSTKVMREMGIPTNKQSALQMDFEGRKALSSKARRNAVLADIAKPGTESARTVNKRIAGKLAKRASLGGVGKFFGRLLPGAAGTAFDVADTAERVSRAARTGSMIDKFQAGVSGVATGAAATGIGEIIATPLQLLNGAIDTGLAINGFLNPKKNKLRMPRHQGRGGIKLRMRK